MNKVNMLHLYAMSDSFSGGTHGTVADRGNEYIDGDGDVWTWECLYNTAWVLVCKAKNTRACSEYPVPVMREIDLHVRIKPVLGVDLLSEFLKKLDGMSFAESMHSMLWYSQKKMRDISDGELAFYLRHFVEVGSFKGIKGE